MSGGILELWEFGRMGIESGSAMEGKARAAVC